MSRSAIYCALIRNGEKRWFDEVWGNVRRELLWGPEAFESWLAEGEEVDWEPEDVSGAAIVDFDNHTLAWGDSDSLAPPRAAALYKTMLAQAWSGFKVEMIPDSELYSRVAKYYSPDTYNGEEFEEEYWEDRADTVIEAAQDFYPGEDDFDEDDDEDYEPDEPFSDDLSGAWITVIDDQGKKRQRGLSAVSQDLLAGEWSGLQALAKLAPLPIPHERYVTEGMWIDISERKLGYWGPDAESIIDRLRVGWKDWEIEQATDGYVSHCKRIGLPGRPMSDAEALGGFLQSFISNKRLNFTNIVGAIGGSLKSTAIKATGCLTLVLSLPILLVGLFMNMWLEAGIALGVLIVIIVVVFKFVELKLKSKFQNSLITEKDEAMEEQRSPVAGPQDEEARKSGIDQLLAACSLPSLSEIEPYFDDMEAMLY